MPHNFIRYQPTGDFHIVPFSCYHRLPYLTTRQARDHRVLSISHLEHQSTIESLGHEQPTPPRLKPMKKQVDDLAPRPLDIRKAVRGKYYDRMQQGTNIVLIAPDLPDTFPDSESVNKALRFVKESGKAAAPNR